MNRLDGKTAIITGAANGMGEAEARLFAREGAKVVVADIAPAGADVAHSIGNAAIFVQHDVTSETSWQNLVRQAEAAFGPVTTLINNAGAFSIGAVADVEQSAFEKLVSVNQLGVFLGMKAVLPSMTAAGNGSIINISSTAGLRGVPGQSVYSSTKWAIRGLTRSAVGEFAPLGIRVNSIHPGPVDTDLLKVNPPEFNQALAQRIPLRRLGQPIDIARVALFLASDEAAYVTGAEIAVDGGISA